MNAFRTCPRPGAHPALRVPSLARLIRALRLWWRYLEERRDLLEIDERQLHDAGINGYEAWQQTRRPLRRAWHDSRRDAAPDSAAGPRAGVPGAPRFTPRRRAA